MEAIADAGTASCGQRQSANRALGIYQRRRPAETVLYQLVQEHLETFLALSDDGPGEGLPGYVEPDFRKYLDCGILARGFARALHRLWGGLPDRLLVQGTRGLPVL